MPHLIFRPSWYVPERHVTPERFVLNRRRFLRQMGVAGATALGAANLGCRRADSTTPEAAAAGNVAGPNPARGLASGRYPAARNPAFNPDWKSTAESAATGYNNFYEFTLDKERVKRLAPRLTLQPWPVRVEGLVERPLTLDAAEWIESMTLEERVYRFRCVEAWAMIVPWTGFPLAKLIDKVQPKAEARFVRFETFNRPGEAPGMADTHYPWPYFEGLRMDEARHPLTLLATGMYGKPLPPQNGAPLRLLVPWKYGYKSIKSIVRIEFVAAQPKTFWETLAPHEYPFESNVNPAVPHPRWSQATERMIDTQDRVKTQPFNGYGEAVAGLYERA